MKRKIVFRGKQLSDGKWVYGDLHHIYKKNELESVVIVTRELYTNGNVMREYRSYVDPDTVGQFIGLKDFNGKEIYEGDIFKDSYYDWDNEEEIEYYITVKWDEPSYGFIVSQSDCHDEVEMHHLAYKEIIGNVHDNPELQKLFEQ